MYYYQYFCGDGGSRTRVRKRITAGIYILSLCLSVLRLLPIDRIQTQYLGYVRFPLVREASGSPQPIDDAEHYPRLGRDNANGLLIY